MSALDAGPGREVRDAHPASECRSGTSASEREVAKASFVATLRIASTVPADPAAHADKVASLARAVAGMRADRRAHVAALIEAALIAEAATRVAHGLPAGNERLPSRSTSLPSAGAAEASDDGPSGSDVTHLDVDEAILRSIGIVRRTMGAPYGSVERGRGWDELEAVAFEPCFETSARCWGGRDRRRALLILWSSLRRRRPVAAAILRRCLRLDRAWRAGAGHGR